MENKEGNQFSDESRVTFWSEWAKNKTPDVIGQMLTKIEENASRDSLTGLLNRRGTEERVNLIEEEARRNPNHKPVGIIFGDVDGLKKVNDAQGHSAGDQMLKNISECYKGSIRKTDICGRWGGDEFVVVIPDANENVLEETVSRIIEKLTEKNVSVSMGLALYKNGDILKALENAEELMREQKNSGLTDGERSKGIGIVTIDL